MLGRGVQRPPPHVLRAWLAAQPWCEVDDGGVIRLSAGVQPRPHRLDDAIAAALRTHPDRPTTAAEIRQAILDADYAPSGVRYLTGASPVHERVGPRRNSATASAAYIQPHIARLRRNPHDVIEVSLQVVTTTHNGPCR